MNQRGVTRDDIFGLEKTIGNRRGASLPSIQDMAQREARGLGHLYVGSEHLLLACLRLVEGEPEEGTVLAATLTSYPEAIADVLQFLGTIR